MIHMVNIQKLKDLMKFIYMKIQAYLEIIIIILFLEISLKIILILIKAQMDYLEKMMMINFLKMNQIKLVYLEMIKIN